MHGYRERAEGEDGEAGEGRDEDRFGKLRRGSFMSSVWTAWTSTPENSSRIPARNDKVPRPATSGNQRGLGWPFTQVGDRDIAGVGAADRMPGGGPGRRLARRSRRQGSGVYARRDAQRYGAIGQDALRGPRGLHAIVTRRAGVPGRLSRGRAAWRGRAGGSHPRARSTRPGGC